MLVEYINIWELIIQSKHKFTKKWYYIAYVEVFGDTYVQNAIGSIQNW